MTVGATATVAGGFWPTNGVNTLTSMSGEGEERRAIARMLGHQGMLPMRAIWLALTGAAPGANASKSRSRVAASAELGGARPIENVVLVNRATTAADVTEIVADFLTMTSRTTYGAAPVANLDRNPLGLR
jgi:hypothetical protein